ncbi:MAG TPA: glycoside hydrolase/phage tail family protein, partial [Rhizomicrobium sp.]|nr:glycoside hydrolase/phage tail family protein [Rhizomicrobium sp.]
MQRTGSRLSDIAIQSSSEGAAIPRLYGRVRAAGQLIWATRFKETVVTTKTRTGGGKGIAPKVTVTQTDYKYSVSFAVGLCEGTITKIGRVWADGTLLDLSQYTTRLYTGSETQTPDPLIVETEGEGNAPAFRGLAYIVFEDMPLESFGNRIPQLSFEIIRSLSAADPSALENVLTGVCLIPGAGEFVYSDTPITADDGEGTTTPQNTHTAANTADIDASLDELEVLAPNARAVSLVAGWFANDLRCNVCQIKPGVETATKDTYPQTWSVNGIVRDAAHLVSASDGRPAYGGTPSDASVIAAIRNLKARGFNVLFNPFLFMDIAPGNALTNPYTNDVGQPAYPWRGRIVCTPAPGVTGSPDKTATATTQVAAFFGTASPSDYFIFGETIAWTGGSEWSYRRMILHYAHLCAVAGGVDAFLIGSELRGLTQTRDSATTYPAVAALKSLAADVRSILGPTTKIGYGADWSEYNAHQTGDAPGALLFNLDPLWSDANIDFIGIDNYLPLADWRDGTAHADYDAANGPTTVHDRTYLDANIEGGEDYDWYYASAEDRDTQTRTAITDGHGKPWVFRAKDIANWWRNPHHNRPDGSEDASPTAWVPQSKPIWFTELGCPAIDKGANHPNVFFDPKSSESAVPYYSNAQRDDLIQRRFLEAHYAHWSDAANNPVSTEYAAPMLDTSHIYVWTWDARPFPTFPSLTTVWGDAANYHTGHWLNGRLGAVQLADLVTDLCHTGSSPIHGGSPDPEGSGEGGTLDTSNLTGLITGYAVTQTQSPRDALQPLAIAAHFDAVESEGAIRFVMRGRPIATALTRDDLALPDNDTGFGLTLTRAQETDLPLAARIAYASAESDYSTSSVEARRLVSASDRIASSQLPIVMDQGQATGIAERLLQDAWQSRETAVFALPPSRLALDPTDEVILDTGTRTHRLRLTEVNDAAERTVHAEATDPSIY